MHIPENIPRNREEYTSLLINASVIAINGGRMDSHPASIISSPMQIPSLSSIPASFPHMAGIYGLPSIIQDFPEQDKLFRPARSRMFSLFFTIRGIQY